MARPKKQGLDYFPFDVDFFEDDKVELIEAEFGYKSIVIIVKLLCKIYKNGYFYNWGDDECLLLAKQLGAGFVPKFVDEVVAGLVRRSFFDKTVFDSFRVLTSRGIQRRYIAVAKDRQKDDQPPNYWLLDVSRPETPVLPRETPVFRPEMPQTKEKESKVNKTTVNKTTGKYISSRTREDFDQRERIFKFFLFEKKIRYAKSESQRFLDVYVGRVDTWPAEVLDAKLRLWEMKSSGKSIVAGAEFWEAWRTLYDFCVQNKTVVDYTVFAEVDNVEYDAYSRELRIRGSVKINRFIQGHAVPRRLFDDGLLKYRFTTS